MKRLIPHQFEGALVEFEFKRKKRFGSYVDSKRKAMSFRWLLAVQSTWGEPRALAVCGLLLLPKDPVRTEKEYTQSVLPVGSPCFLALLNTSSILAFMGPPRRQGGVHCMQTLPSGWRQIFVPLDFNETFSHIVTEKEIRARGQMQVQRDLEEGSHRKRKSLSRIKTVVTRSNWVVGLWLIIIVIIIILITLFFLFKGKKPKTV